MKFEPSFFDYWENTSGDFLYPRENIKAGKEVKFIKAVFNGPFYSNKNTQIGPDVEVGKYTGFNESCFFARGKIGSYCAIGARSSINPFNHPTDWLSTNEFQYHPNSFDWVEEYNTIQRLERTPDMFRQTIIGNDVWLGHNVNIMSGVNIADGAVIGAGSIVTKDVPAYAIVAGCPAKIIKYRFSGKIIEKLLNIKWWDMELDSLSGLPFRDIEECIDILESKK